MESVLFTDDIISNLKLVQTFSPEFKEIFRCIKSIEGVLYGGCVRELVRCTSVREYLIYLKNADIDVACPKRSPRNTKFETLLRNNFEVESQLPEDWYSVTSVAETNVREKLRRMSYDSWGAFVYSIGTNPERFQNDIEYELRKMATDRIMTKRITSDRADKLSKIEFNKMAETSRFQIKSESCNMYVDLSEANDIKTYLKYHTDFDINNLMIDTNNLQLSVKPESKISVKTIIALIKRNEFNPISKNFEKYNKRNNLANLFKRFLRMTRHGYYCNLRLNTREADIISLALRHYLIKHEFCAKTSEEKLEEIEVIKTILQSPCGKKIWNQDEAKLIRLACAYHNKSFLKYVLGCDKYQKDSDPSNIIIEEIYSDPVDVKFIQETQLLDILTEYSTKNIINPETFTIISDMTQSIIRTLVESGNTQMIRSFINACQLDKNDIMQCFENSGLLKNLIDENKLEMTDYWLSKIGSSQSDKQKCFIVRCLRENHIDMAYLLKKHGFRIQIGEFTWLTDIDAIIKLLRNPKVKNFLQECPSFNLSETHLHSILKMATYEDIIYLCKELNVKFVITREIILLLFQDYPRHKDKILWLLSNVSNKKLWDDIGCTTLIDLRPTDIVLLRKTYSFNFLLETVFYNCAVNTKFERFNLHSSRGGPIYVYEHGKSNIAWRFRTRGYGNGKSLYDKVIFELLFQLPKFQKLSLDLQNHIRKFLY